MTHKRPIAPPRISLDATIAALRAGLDPQPARVAVYAARAALHHLERMQEEQRATQRELWDARHIVELIVELYNDVVHEHNDVWAEARKRGIEVFQPFRSDDWTWTNGERRGTGSTPAAALLAALDDPAKRNT